jgi:hypothetical protein
MHPSRRQKNRLCAATAEALEERRLLSASFRFQNQVTYSLGTATPPVNVAAADLNGDGKLDLVTSNYNGTVSVLLGNGNGTFKPAQTFSDGLPNGPGGLAVADLITGDSTPDVVVSYGGSKIAVLIGNTVNGTFSFGDPQIINVSGNIDSLTTAVLSGDGVPDIITADSNGSISVLMGNSNGTFQSPVNTEVTDVSSGTNFIISAEFGNGEEGVAVSNYSAGTISVLMGTGIGTFNPPQTYTVGGGVVALTAADLTGDNLNDLIAVHGDGQVSEILATAGGQFAAPTTFNVYVSTVNGAEPIGNATGIAVADFGGDGGNADLLITYAIPYSYGQQSISFDLVVPGNGNGTFGPATYFPVGSYYSYPHDSIAADVNGDGQPDIITADFDTSGVSVLLNQTTSPSLAFTSEPANAVAGTTLGTVVVDVLNAEGDVSATDDSPVTLSLYSGPSATLNGTLTVNAVNGVATFTGLSINTAGMFSLEAADATDSAIAGTSSVFTVNAAAPSKLAIVSQPNGATVGLAFSPALIVDVEDQFGNLVNDSDSITVSVAGGPSQNLMGSTTMVATNGQAAFATLALSTPGTYTFSAVDQTESLATATSGPVTVFTDTPTQLAFSAQPSSGTAGTALGTFTVSVENGNANVVTSDSSNITLAFASNPGGAVLGGTFTALAVNGVATFGGVVLNTAGTYTLFALDTADSVPAVTSDAFNVSPSTASTLVFVQQSSILGAGAKADYVVDVEDQYGNIETSDESALSLSVVGGGTGRLLAGAISTDAVNGVATFDNFSFTTIGTYALTVTDNADGTLTAQSHNVDVTVASTKLVFANQPNSTLAGAPINTLVVYVEDTKSQVVLTDDSTVTVAIHSGAKGATLEGTASVMAVNGTATFTGLSINDDGAFSLKATDSVAKLTAATSHNFTLTPTLGFQQQPTNVIAGVKFSPSIVVDFLGATDAIVGNASASVKLSVASGPGKLLGSATASAKNGVVTFSNLYFDTAGTYTLKVTSGSLPSITSETFVVSAALAHKLVFEPLPSISLNTAATIVVEVEDQFGNVETTDDSTLVTLTPSPSSAFGPISMDDVNGVASFTGVVINTSGGYQFKATAGGDTQAVSKRITVKS